MINNKGRGGYKVAKPIINDLIEVGRLLNLIEDSFEADVINNLPVTKQNVKKANRIIKKWII